MKNLLLLLLILSLSKICSQEAFPTESIQTHDEDVWEKWLVNIYEIGVHVENDTLRITEEAKQAASNQEIRNILYPSTYTLPKAQFFLSQMQVKIALWHLVNLYASDKTYHEPVLKYVVGLDKVIDMERAITSSFYTYIFFDPQAGEMMRGKPTIKYPQVLDTKLAAAREIIDIVLNERKKNG